MFAAVNRRMQIACCTRSDSVARKGPIALHVLHKSLLFVVWKVSLCFEVCLVIHIFASKFKFIDGTCSRYSVSFTHENTPLRTYALGRRTREWAYQTRGWDLCSTLNWTLSFRYMLAAVASGICNFSFQLTSLVCRPSLVRKVLEVVSGKDLL